MSKGQVWFPHLLAALSCRLFWARKEREIRDPTEAIPAEGDSPVEIKNRVAVDFRCFERLCDNRTKGRSSSVTALVRSFPGLQDRERSTPQPHLSVGTPGPTAPNI